MVKLSMVIIVAVSLTLLLGSEGKSFQKRGTVQVVQTNDIFGWLCQNNPWNSGFNWCTLTTVPPKVSSTTTTTTTSTTTTSTTTISTTTEVIEDTTTTEVEIEDTTPTTQSSSTTGVTVENTTSTMSTTTTKTTNLSTISLPTALERAHWCQFSNGSYVAVGQTFMYTTCLLCQCTQSHAIVCNSLQCQPSYCDDGTTPVYKNDQCCPHCQAVTPTSCIYGGISFPDGSIIKSTANDIQCWCQTGSIECRRISPVTNAPTSSLSDYYSGNGTSIYIIIVIVCVLLIFGSLLCCGGAVIYYYYYYYYQNQQSAQQAYDQYYTSAGWQPMGEDGQIVDASVLEKQAEAEKGQDDQEHPTGLSQQYIPPPYAAYNGPYESGHNEKI